MTDHEIATWAIKTLRDFERIARLGTEGDARAACEMIERQCGNALFNLQQQRPDLAA